MAEIFGAVASGAGLVSLSMQLLESAQKLKGFHDACRDAPDTVRQLCFDLETMSMALRQFEQYRQNDFWANELLSRCILACDQAVSKIKAAVEKVDRVLSKARFAGKLYMGFKEPEVKKLLEEMEHAKSSMLLAYTSYCQSWNMRESAKHAASFQLQRQKLETLQASVESGNTALIERVTAFATQKVAAASLEEPASSSDTVCSRSPRMQARRGKMHKYRIALPRWLVKCVWEFGLHEHDNVWTFQLYPINLRPAHTYVFDFLRIGDVEAVRELLQSRELSFRDREQPEYGVGGSTLLEIAAAGGHVELCKFLLQETSSFHEDAILGSALVRALWWAQAVPYDMSTNSLTDAFYNLFVADHGLEVGLTGFTTTDGPSTARLALLLTNNSFRVVMKSQPTSFVEMSFEQRFAQAIESVGWPADAFLALLHHSDPMEVARKTNAHGKTALHWAAAHLGEGLRESSRWRLGDIHPERGEKARGYGKLMSRLIRMGADVHSLWSTESRMGFETWGLREKDPFLVYLEGVVSLHTDQWDSEALSDAVCQWGQILLEGGVDLPGYVVAENNFLQSIQPGDMNNALNEESWIGGPVFLPVRLSITNVSILSLKVVEIPYFHIWTSTVGDMPGAWPKSPSSQDTIIWNPEELDERDGLRWVYTGIKFMKMCPTLAETDKTTSNIYATSRWYTLNHESDLQDTQDDHGPAATLIRRERKLQRERNEAPTRRRRAFSSSPLCETPTLQRDIWIPYSRDTIVSIYGASRWKYMIHKCPFDSSWRRCSRVLAYDRQLWRFCMQGRCQETLMDSSEDQNDVISWFLRNEDYVHVAKRFAAKFCPEQMEVVERNLERVTERARLAMGSKRANT